MGSRKKTPICGGANKRGGGTQATMEESVFLTFKTFSQLKKKEM